MTCTFVVLAPAGASCPSEAMISDSCFSTAGFSTDVPSCDALHIPAGAVAATSAAGTFRTYVTDSEGPGGVAIERTDFAAPSRKRSESARCRRHRSRNPALVIGAFQGHLAQPTHIVQRGSYASNQPRCVTWRARPNPYKDQPDPQLSTPARGTMLAIVGVRNEGSRTTLEHGQSSFSFRAPCRSLE